MNESTKQLVVSVVESVLEYARDVVNENYEKYEQLDDFLGNTLDELDIDHIGVKEFVKHYGE